MDGENNERCNIDCPDDTNLDITFTQVLKGNEYDTRRVDELTAAESSKTSPEDLDEFSNIDLSTGTQEAFSAFGITPVLLDQNSTVSNLAQASGGKYSSSLDNSKGKVCFVNKDRNVGEISASQISGSLFGLWEHLPSARDIGYNHTRSSQPEVYLERDEFTPSRVGRRDVINKEYSWCYKGKELNRLDPHKYGILPSLSNNYREEHQTHLSNAQLIRGSASAKGDSFKLKTAVDTNKSSAHHWPTGLDCTGPLCEPLRQLRQEQQRSSPKKEQHLRQHQWRKSSQSKVDIENNHRSHQSPPSAVYVPFQTGAETTNTFSPHNNKDNGATNIKVMNNYTSLLDGQYSMANNNIPRQAPSPSQGQHQPNGIVGSNNSNTNSNGNGVNGNVGNSPGLGSGGAVGTGSNGIAGAGISFLNGLPSAGHQTDMNYLWSVVQQLSEVLADNRAQTAGIVRSVQHLQTRAVAEGISPTIGEVNGEISNASVLSSINGSMSNDNISSSTSSNNLASTNSTFPPSSSSQQTTSSASATIPASTTSAATTTSATAAEILSLQTLLTASERRATALESHTVDLRSLVNDYEAAMQLILDKLRTYAYNHTHALIALHAHYNGLLTTERNTNLDLRLEHQSWQAGLARVAEYARVALREHGDARLPYLRRIAALKGENRVLRSLAGWEMGPEGEGSESGSEVDGEREFGRLVSVDEKDMEKGMTRDGQRLTDT